MLQQQTVLLIRPRSITASESMVKPSLATSECQPCYYLYL